MSNTEIDVLDAPASDMTELSAPPVAAGSPPDTPAPDAPATATDSAPELSAAAPEPDGGGGGGGDAYPPTPIPAPAKPNLGIFANAGRALESINLEAAVARRAKIAGTLAEYRARLAEGEADLRSIRDQIDNPAPDVRSALTRFLARKSVIDRSRVELAEERDLLLPALGMLRGYIADIEARSNDFPFELRPVLDAVSATVPALQQQARSDLDLAYADATAIGYGFGSTDLKNLAHNLGDALASLINAGVYGQRESFGCSAAAAAFIDLATPILKALGLPPRFVKAAPRPVLNVARPQ